MKGLVTVTLLFSGCCSVAALMLGYEFMVGSISSRGLGIGLACLFVLSFLVIFAFRRSRSTRESVLSNQDAASGVKSRRTAAITVGKIAIALLIVLFLNGVWHLRDKPLIPQLVGLGANLLVTVVVIGAVRKMKKSSG